MTMVLPRPAETFGGTGPTARRGVGLPDRTRQDERTGRMTDNRDNRDDRDGRDEVFGSMLAAVIAVLAFSGAIVAAAVWIVLAVAR